MMGPGGHNVTSLREKICYAVLENPFVDEGRFFIAPRLANGPRTFFTLNRETLGIYSKITNTLSHSNSNQ